MLETKQKETAPVVYDLNMGVDDSKKMIQTEEAWFNKKETPILMYPFSNESMFAVGNYLAVAELKKMLQQRKAERQAMGLSTGPSVFSKAYRYSLRHTGLGLIRLGLKLKDAGHVPTEHYA